MVYSPPEVDRIWGTGGLFLVYLKPYSIYLRGILGFRELRVHKKNVGVQVQGYGLGLGRGCRVEGFRCEGLGLWIL